MHKFVPVRPPVGESQSNGILERTVGLVASQARPLRAALEHCVGVNVPWCECIVLAGGLAAFR